MSPEFLKWWKEFEKGLDVFERSLARDIAWAAWKACGEVILKQLQP